MDHSLSCTTYRQSSIFPEVELKMGKNTESWKTAGVSFFQIFRRKVENTFGF